MEIRQGLCFRCEHRAQFYETGHGMRCECQTPSTNVYSCYMYKPVIPVVTQKNKGDRRSSFAGAMLSARSHFLKVADVALSAKMGRDGMVLYWIPKNLVQRKRKLNNRYKILKQSAKNEQNTQRNSR